MQNAPATSNPDIEALLQLLAALMKKQGQGGGGAGPRKFDPSLSMTTPPAGFLSNLSPALLESGKIATDAGSKNVGYGLDASAILASLFR